MKELRMSTRSDNLPFCTSETEKEKGYKILDEKNNISIDFKKLKNINADITGWIIVTDTHIDYPVLQGDSLEQYLNRGYDGQYNTLGSIFTYPGTDLEKDGHIVLFGHRTYDCQMFGDLNDFSNQDYAQNCNVYLYTDNQCRIYQVAASYLCSPSDETLTVMKDILSYDRAVKDNAQMNGWIDEQLWDAFGDVLTLVTCPSEDSVHYRRVVQCVRGETYGDSERK